MKKKWEPMDWGLSVNSGGELMIGGVSTVSLADRFGTPLHVLNEARLIQTASSFVYAAQSEYSGKTTVHYAYKCNSVPAVVRVLKEAGLKAEVMSPFELYLALNAGHKGGDIIVNGPCKTRKFLEKCLETHVRFIIIDSLEELEELDILCNESGHRADVLLRINPDYTPRGTNQGSATASRKGCAFGLDLKGGEVPEALIRIKQSKGLEFHGFHFHIGTGLKDSKDYSNALQCLGQLKKTAEATGFSIRVLDVGGGFASRTTREFTSRELLVYQGFERLPSATRNKKEPTHQKFTREISRTIEKFFPHGALPELLYEPGRSIASPNQFLLLTVHRVKERRGIKKWLITDGGLGTVTLPTFYEYHEIFLCNDVFRPAVEKSTIIGPVCFASDVVYRNKLMPRVQPGEVLALMDSGAYFTAMESSFGFPHPAIVSVKNNSVSLIRRTETFADMTGRDVYINPKQQKEEKNEVFRDQT
ncbi:MAG: hypothetical protein JXB26_16570 [Candidatus Aminicenantes bacterium]|nr:hypothetical protein [Candidatus Aminicenantes bacterium]